MTPGPLQETLPLAWSRAEKLVFVAFIAGLTASVFFLVHPWFDAARDSATYLAGARSILAGEGYEYLGDPFTLRPPGYSVLIAPTVAAFGNDFFALNLTTSLWGLVAVLLLHCYLRTRVGRVLSLVTCIGIWLNPGFRQLSSQILAEVPALTWLLLALLVDRACARRTSWRRELLLGLIIGLGAYVRFHLVLLVPAILLSRFFQRFSAAGTGLPWMRFFMVRLALFTLTTVLVGMPWTIRNQGAEVRVPADQTQNYSYDTWMWNRDTGDPHSERLGIDEVLGRIPERTGNIAAGMGSRLRSMTLEPEHWPLAAFFLIAVVVAFVRRQAPVDFFVLGTLVLLGISSSFATRLLLPVYVFALPAALSLGLALLQRFLDAPRAVWLVALIGLAAIWLDTRPRYRWKVLAERDREAQALVAEVDALLAPDARLAAMLGFRYTVLLERPVHSLAFALKRSGHAGMEELIDRYAINTILITPAEGAGLLPYLRTRYGPIEEGKRVTVVRVRP